MRRLPLIVLSFALTAALASCGDGTDTSTDTTAGFGSPGSTAETSAPPETAPAVPPKEGDAGVKVSGDMENKPTVDLPGGEPPKELLFKDIKAGTGAEVKAGTSTNFQYVGISWSTGKEFDASWGRGQPFPSDLSGVIPGWTNGIPGMKVGGRRLLVIPPEQGYGESGQGEDIGPNETLVFVIDAVE